MENYYFIINPLAASGKAALAWRDCKNYLDKHKIKYEAFMTSYAGHAIELAAMITTGPVEEGEEKILLVIGGDGTLGEVVSGLHISSKVAVGYIPAGSGNDFARSNHLSKKAVKRLKQILKKKRVIWMDYGIISYIRDEMHQRRTVVSAGMGLDASICEGVAKSPAKISLNKLHLGKFIYIWIGLQKIFREKPFSVDMYLNGDTMVHLDSVRYISMQIQPFEGGGFKMAPKASAQDGQFDLCIVTAKSKLKLIGILLAALRGKHVKKKGVQIISCNTAQFRTDRDVFVHTDGDICGELSEFGIMCEQCKIRMIL